MKSKHTSCKWLGLGMVALAGVMGCADRNKNGEPDSPATTAEVQNTVTNAGGKVEDAAKSAANTVTNLADAAVITPKIKNALGANAALKGTSINVDTQGSKDTVYLTGTVQNATQSKAAAMIAKHNAPGYKIVNQLKMGKK